MSTFAIGGLSTGLDTKSIISQLIAIDSAPKTKMQWKNELFSQRKAAWSDLNTRLGSLKSTANVLLRPETWDVNAFAASAATTFTATSGDPGKLGPTADSTASANSYSIDVLQRAQREISVSTGGLASIGANDTLTIANGSGSWDVAVTAGDTMADVIGKINATSGIGVAASLQGGEIRLQSNGIGAASAFTVSSLGATAGQLGFAETQAAQDAQYTVDGVLHTSATNTNVSGAITGVKLNLLGATSTTLDVTAGDGTSAEDAWVSATKKKITDFVAQYNSVLGHVHQKTQGESRVTNPKTLNEYIAGPMARNSQFSNIAFQMREQTYQKVTGLADGDNLLRDIGITTSFGVSGGAANGQLVVDDAKLDAALRSNPTRVQELLGRNDTGTTGISMGDGVLRRVSEAVQDIQSRIDVTSNSLSTQIGSMQRSIDAATDRIERRKVYYEKMFSSLETRIGEMQSQNAWVSSQFASLSG